MGGAKPPVREADLFLALQDFMVKSHWAVKGPTESPIQSGDEYGQKLMSLRVKHW